MRIIKITGSDRRIDIKDNERILDTPVNSYPSTCLTCNFPNIDLTPNPYFIIKSRAFTPNEIQLADQGNLLIKVRTRKIFELIIPDTCVFHPTFFENTAIQTPWYLAIPKKTIVSGILSASVPKCPTCGKPEESHPGTQYTWQVANILEETEHVLKSSNWSTLGYKWWDTWIHRDVFMSLRFLNLLKQVKIKGVLQCYHTTPLNKEERIWIEEKLEILNTHALNKIPLGVPSKEDLSWFRNLIKDLPVDKRQMEIIKKLEIYHKIILPSYVKDFFARSIDILTLSKIFKNTIVFLPLNEWDFECFDKKIIYAYNIYGDKFCFEMIPGSENFKILLFNHEYGMFEDFANNFIDFIRQWHKRASEEEV